MEAYEKLGLSIWDRTHDLQTDIDALGQTSSEELERVAIRLKKSSINVQSVLLAWEPCWETRPGLT